MDNIAMTTNTQLDQSSLIHNVLSFSDTLHLSAISGVSIDWDADHNPYEVSLFKWMPYVPTAQTLPTEAEMLAEYDGLHWYGIRTSELHQNAA